MKSTSIVLVIFLCLVGCQPPGTSGSGSGDGTGTPTASGTRGESTPQSRAPVDTSSDESACQAFCNLEDPDGCDFKSADVCATEPVNPSDPDFDCGQVLDADGSTDCLATCVKGFRESSNSKTCQRAIKAQIGCLAQYCNTAPINGLSVSIEYCDSEDGCTDPFGLGSQCDSVDADVAHACSYDTERAETGAGPYFAIGQRTISLTKVVVPGVCPIPAQSGQFR
ncbi:MAG: hypothetical protein VX589_04190, partial [Myxococcota bacterium]|nr:hypothetical protein [Myxococcota bacterium]